MLQAIVRDAWRVNSLSSIWLATACLLSFAGFLRSDELVNIRPCDLKFGDSHLTLHLPWSKTDQWQQGVEMLIARTGSETCPVAMVEEYMRRGRITANSKDKLFRPIVSGKSEKLRDSGGLSYSRFWELLKQKLEELGFHAVNFSTHSLRAGGATSAAGVLDRVFKKHGRCKSETARDGYIEEKALSPKTWACDRILCCHHGS